MYVVYAQIQTYLEDVSSAIKTMDAPSVKADFSNLFIITEFHII